MGNSYEMKCQKCGYDFKRLEGVGFLFPTVYQETVRKAKDGELGKEIQDFFKENETGAINAENVTLCCDKCGHLSKGKDLTMYIPKGKQEERPKHGQWSIAAPFVGADYVMKSELKERYDEYTTYPHICEECGGRMHIVGENEKIICPKCKIPLDIVGNGCWD